MINETLDSYHRKKLEPLHRFFLDWVEDISDIRDHSFLGTDDMWEDIITNVWYVAYEEARLQHEMDDPDW